MPIVSSAQLTVTDVKDALVYGINASAPVITKQAHDAATLGAYSSITVRGKKHLGNIISNYGFLTVTANGAAEASTATDTSSGSITIAPASNSGVSSYTVNMYDQATVASATLLDSTVIQVVFKGNSAISVVLSNESHVFPAGMDGTVQSYTDSGTTIRVYEGATALEFVTGTPANGQWRITTAATNIIPGTITDSGAFATVGAHSGVVAGVDTALITYTISGLSSTGVSFSLDKAQTFSKSKTGATGATGSAAITAILSNEAHVLPAATDGAVSSYVGSGTAIRVYEGAAPVVYDGVGTANGTWKIASTVVTNVTLGTITGSGNYATIGVASGVAAGTDTASIDFNITGTTAAGAAFSLTKTQTFSKSKTGTSGSDATAYWLVKSAAAVQKSIAGVYTPSAVTYTIKSATGTGSPANYAGRFIIATSTDGTTYADVYTSASNESSKAYTVPAGISLIRVKACLAGGTATLLDEMITPIVSDGSTGATGQSQVKGVCFLRSVSAPATPTGGSYASPTATGWSDGIPADNNQALWQTTRIFTSNEASPQQSVWSTPAKVGTPSTSTKTQFSIDGSTFWHDTPATADIYMRTGTSTDNEATWTYAGSVKIKGEIGATGATGATGAAGSTGATGAPGQSVVLSPAAPTFTSSDRVINAGQSIVFSVVAASVTPTSYAWTFSGLESNPAITNQSTVTITSTHFGRSNSATVSCMINGDTSLVATRTITRNEAHSVAVGAWYANSLVLKNPADSSNLGIAMDTNSHKRITWNDGDGNWNFRAGNYRDTAAGITKYIKGTNDANSGAAVLTATMDGLDGMWKMRVAPIGAPDTAVTWGSTFTVAVGYINNNADVIYFKNKADTALYGKFDATGLTVRNGAFFQDSNSVTVAVMGPDGDLWKGSADNTGSKYWHAGNMGSASGLDADTVDGYHASNLAALAENETITGLWQFSQGVNLGAARKIYQTNLDFGGDAAGTWRKIAAVSLAGSPAMYSAAVFMVNIVDPNANYGISISVNADRYTYYIACNRTSDVTMNTPDACYVSGPGSHVRAVKTSTGNYEIQVKNEAQYQEYLVTIQCYAENANQNAATYLDGSAVGSTGTAQYNASVGTATDWFQKVTATNSIVSTITTGTKPLDVQSQTLCTNLNADMVDGKHVGTSGSAIPAMDGGNTWSGNQIFSNSLTYMGVYNSNSAMEFGTGAANYPLIDFHSSTVYADYNARISCSNGTGDSGTGVLSLQASALNIYGHSFLAMNPAGTSYFIYADASAVQLFNKTTIGAGSNNIVDGVAAARPLLVNSSDINTTLGSSSNAIAICNTATTSGNVSQLNFSAITGVSTNQYSSGWIAVKHGARVNGEYPAGEMAFAISKSVAGTSNFAPTIRLHLTNSGTLFKDSAGATVAVLGEDGDMWKGSADNTGSKYWHAGNMGSASGLDADTVDGKHGAYYSDLANATGTLSSSRLADSGVVSGTYNSSSTIIRPFTIDAKGRITSVGANVTIAPAFSDVINKPTTLAGYGITDAQALDAGLTAIAALTGANGIVKKTAGVWALDTTTYGTITSVTATYPVASSGGTAPVISMPAATALNPGYLTASDWLTFNNKSNTAGTVTSVSVTSANGVSGTVATSSTTPAITLTLGALTGTSFNSITGLSTATPIVAGTGAVGTGVTVARADHVHPAQTTVSGNSGGVTAGAITTAMLGNNVITSDKVNSSVVITNGTYQKIFGNAFASTPANTATPATWLALTINGVAYRVPLYQ